MTSNGYEHDYDMVVIGSGPAGQRAAIQASKLNKRTALVERKTVIGGVCINTGTIPSKTLREAVLHLSGYRLRGLYGASYTVKEHITMQDLQFRTDHVVRHEIDVTRHQLMRNDVEVLTAEASFVDPHRLRLTENDARGARGTRDVTASRVVIATGTEATRDARVPFDGQRVCSSDDILGLQRLPRSLTVVGAGVIGLEYASLFATLGVRVTIIDKRHRLLPFVDSEMIDMLVYQLRENRVTFRLGEEVSGMELITDMYGDRVRIHLASGKQVVTDAALYSVGRTGATSQLNLAAAGLDVDDRGRLPVNENFQTSVPHVYAVGDVIGFPSLASTSMEQGRLAACHAFEVEASSVPALFPYGIYSIPEISMVGQTEDELTEAGVPYEVGKAHYREIARGQIIGDNTGLLKLLFHLDSHALLGVHIVGEGASELVHIGQAVLTFGGAIEYFVNTVFNYPTLAECYKTAAFDGINRLGVAPHEALSLTAQPGAR
ncbi:MAG: Si-specific NAD(P)(+) transhydrogenase [Chloroflexi bacterium]|nr:Si-specific NAD(P)(+) transhydrogenase [Chloroflexota bacterium]MBV9543342.1 Si-specific NAD(P)(+) transhydrogenase [Chloroflexota bacterium]